MVNVNTEKAKCQLIFLKNMKSCISAQTETKSAGFWKRKWWKAQKWEGFLSKADNGVIIQSEAARMSTDANYLSEALLH